MSWSWLPTIYSPVVRDLPPLEISKWEIAQNKILSGKFTEICKGCEFFNMESQKVLLDWYIVFYVEIDNIKWL